MKKVFKFLLNKYILTTLGFVVWMIYFDQNDLMQQQERKKELQAAKDDISYLQREINSMQNEQSQLANDPKMLEQYARENFHMKKDNEDLYLIR